jgi:hypothetical protein
MCFMFFGTGFELENYDKKHYDYVKTIQQIGITNLVWHIFEVHDD